MVGAPCRCESQETQTVGPRVRVLQALRRRSLVRHLQPALRALRHRVHRLRAGPTAGHRAAGTATGAYDVTRRTFDAAVTLWRVVFAVAFFALYCAVRSMLRR